MAKTAVSKSKSEKRTRGSRKSPAAKKNEEMKTDSKATSGDSKAGEATTQPAAGAAQQPAAAAAQGQQMPKVQVLRQYIRDFSFENIMLQKNVRIPRQTAPEINVQVALDAKRRPENMNQYEVLTKYSISSRIASTNDTLFLLELEYCGIFHIENIPQQRLHPFLMIDCPRTLFPYVRRIVADTTGEGGFPPLNLDMIDFVALYRQMLQQRANQSGQQAPS